MAGVKNDNNRGGVSRIPKIRSPEGSWLRTVYGYGVRVLLVQYVPGAREFTVQIVIRRTG